MKKSLVRLLPEDVERRWGHFRPAIASALPPTVGTNRAIMVNVLVAILTEKVEVWAYQDDERVIALVLTVFHYDGVVGSNHLLIYAMAAFEPLKREDWQNGIIALQRYARSRGCVSIFAYTTLNGLAGLVERAGGYADVTLLEIPLDGSMTVR